MCREITKRQTQKKMQILSTCYSQKACYCNKKNHFYADICKTLVTTDVPRNCDRKREFKISFLEKYCSNTRGCGWHLCVSAERWYCWCFCVSVSMQMILVTPVHSHSKKKPNIWNSASVSRRRMLATVVLCSGDFKFYFHTSHITPLQLVMELRGLEWTCV